MSKSTPWCIIWDNHHACYQMKEQGNQCTQSFLIDQGNDVSHQWLEQISSFAFHSKDSNHVTVRKERRERGGVYWVAYRKVKGKLKRKYIGPSEKLTLYQLENIATMLAQQEVSNTSYRSHATIQTAISNPEINGTLVPNILQDNLLATKFFIPTTTHELISRRHLNDLLTEGLQGPLTLISAPAGFGKTTALIHWINSSIRADKKHDHIAWLSLDERDNNAIRFWLYVLKALDMSDPGIATPALQLLQIAEKPGLEYMLTVLINTLSQTANTYILILDDFYLMSEPAIHLSLQFLLEHQPPQLHLVILTRTDPPLNLSRLRARRQLLEVRTEQLRLNTKETHAFLKDVMYLNLAPELVRKIARRTEGWLAGLQLLGLSLHNCANPAEVLKRSNGNHRYILDYLTEEVLRQQSAEIRQFLLQTSILKRLSAPLCNAVIEKTDSQNILTYLEHANVFLIPLDEERNWYRYHTLFADTLYVLLKQEDPDVISQLHLRASQWYASHDILVEAVQHALQAQAWQRVADLVEPFTEALMTQKYVHIWRYCEEIPMMLRWLHQLPAEIVHTRPHLSLYYARSLFIAGHPTEAERWLQTAETELLISAQDSSTVYKSADDDHEKLQGEIIARRAIIAAYRGDNQAAQDYCQQANSYLSAEHVFQQSLIAVARGMIAFNMGQLPAATQQLLLASTLSQHVGMPGDIINYMSMAASFLHMQGQLHEAYNVLQQAIRRGMGIRPDSYPLAIVGVAYVYQADILREWNQLEQALELIQQGIRFIEQTKYTHYLDVAYTVLTRIYLSRNDVDEAQRVLQQVKHIPAFEENPDRQSWLIAMEQARICITQGKLDAAIATRSIPDRENYASSRLSQDREATALARLTLARGQYAQALTCLEPLLNNAIITNRQDHVIEIRLLQALAYQGQQDEQHALTALAEAVQQAAPETYMRRFLDEGPMLKQLLEKLKKQEQRQELTSYLDKLLNAFPTAEHDGKQNMTATDLQQSNHASLPLFIEPLSKREQEVLQLIAQGASNQEIAQQLTISINTVKGHTSNILMKLEASNRTQAVNLALSLGLLTLE